MIAVASENIYREIEEDMMVGFEAGFRRHDTKFGLAGEPQGAITKASGITKYQTTFPGLCICNMLGAAGSISGEQVFFWG